MTPPEPANRRPIQARGNRHIIRLAAYLARRQSPTPNQISCLSAVFALLGLFCLLAYRSGWFMPLLAALFIQLRLLCNLIDGMVAVEGGKKTAVGEIYNEFPDRIADTLLLVGAGYAAGCGWLGWLAALLAAFTAYIRVFGGSLGFAQSFAGPLAKQQRMAVLTAACLLGALESAAYGSGSTAALFYGLVLIALGTAWTCWTRTRAIAALMRARPPQ